VKQTAQAKIVQVEVVGEEFAIGADQGTRNPEEASAYRWEV